MNTFRMNFNEHDSGGWPIDFDSTNIQIEIEI